MTLYLILIMALVSQPKTDTVYVCPDKPPHSCNWFNCELKEQYIFDDTVDGTYPYNNIHSKTSSNYWFDKNHFENPTLTIDELNKKLKKELLFANL